MATAHASAQAPFVLVLPTRPASVQSEGKGKYQQRIREAAAVAFQKREQLRGSLYARITYLHRSPTTQDVDNIAKPILDAMAGVVFADDRSIRQCIIERISIRDGFTVSEHNRPAEGVERLVDFLADAAVAHVVYLEIGQAPAQVITFGSIAEG